MSSWSTDFVAEVKNSIPFHSSFIDEAMRTLTVDERASLDEYVDYCMRLGRSASNLAECYCTIVEDAYISQIQFQKTGRYAQQSFAEAEKAVYANADFMERYMVGLAITSFLWPNHRAILKFFLEWLPKGRGDTYFEVGPGHGYYFIRALRATSFTRFKAVDVSPKSIELTKSLVAAWEPDKLKNVNFILGDFFELSFEDAPFDVLVMGEVLEHVERPERFLARLFNLCAPNGVAFITTCVNAPQIDHISLFSSPGEVEDLILESGFVIEKRLEVPYVGKTLKECAEKRLPVNVAYQLRRNA